MDESLDELVVPDDWLNHSYKRKVEESDDASLPVAKEPRLTGSPLITVSASVEFCDLESTNGTETVEDTTVNEPDSDHDEDPNVSLTAGNCRGKKSQNSITNELNGIEEGVLSEVKCLTEETSVYASICEVSNGLEDSSILRDAEIITGIVPGQDFNNICTMLLEHRDKNNRLDIVTFQLTNSEETPTHSEGIASYDIFEEVQQVLQAVPSANVNEVYAMLEVLPPSSHRTQDVITNLMSRDIPSNQRENSSHPDLSLVNENNSTATADDSHLENDPLLEDMRTIAKMFPEKDRNEIYALLEANFNKDNRVESVINEMLHIETTDTPETLECVISDDVEKMRNIFPDCDPNYLYEKLDSMKNVSNRTHVLATEMFEKRDYPKLKDLLDKEKAKEVNKRARNLIMTPEEFLQKFPEPLKTFEDVTREPSEVYKQHAEICLKNEFPLLKSGYLKKVLAKYKGHLYPAYKKISAFVLETPLDKRSMRAMFMRESRPGNLAMPDTVDEFFYHELWFVRNELSVVDHIKQKEERRKVKVERARMTGELCECCCCFDDECLLEDLTSCPEGHLFCKTCLVRSTEAAFGEMKTKFPCLTDGCDQNISLSTLQAVVPANLFSKIVRRLQEEEVQQANIPDLVTCPFCPFAAIMSNPDDKVLKCLNPECLKESCRLCQELNHIPLRCNEVEKKTETDMRVYIENMISEAVMRKCHKCGKRFVKEDGCNKMTCVCGATSCYACKEFDIDYDHFNNNQRCANTDPATIHQHDMEEAAIKAKNQYLLEHPEAADVELKTDITDMIKSFKDSSGHRDGRYMPMDNEDYGDDEEYDEDESDVEDNEYDTVESEEDTDSDEYNYF